MTKKELIKRIEEYKPKYIYQRYDGRINKFEVVDTDKGVYIDTETCMPLDFNRHIPFGKVSENLIDLIEVGDCVKVHNLKGDDITFIFQIYDEKTMMDFKLGLDAKEIEILEIVTQEQFESVSYKVK